MAWLASDKNGERIFEEKPIRGRTQEHVSFSKAELYGSQYDDEWYPFAYDIDDFNNILYVEDGIDLPSGTIRKIIGKDLSWEDDPIEI